MRFFLTNILTLANESNIDIILHGGGNIKKYGKVFGVSPGVHTVK